MWNKQSMVTLALSPLHEQLISLPAWEQQLDHTLGHLDPLLPRKEVRQQAKNSVQGLLGPVERTAGNWPNTWDIATRIACSISWTAPSGMPISSGTHWSALSSNTWAPPMGLPSWMRAVFSRKACIPAGSSANTAALPDGSKTARSVSFWATRARLHPFGPRIVSAPRMGRRSSAPRKGQSARGGDLCDQAATGPAHARTCVFGGRSYGLGHRRYRLRQRSGPAPEPARAAPTLCAGGS